MLGRVPAHARHQRRAAVSARSFVDHGGDGVSDVVVARPARERQTTGHASGPASGRTRRLPQRRRPSAPRTESSCRGRGGRDRRPSHRTPRSALQMHSIATERSSASRSETNQWSSPSAPHWGKTIWSASTPAPARLGEAHHDESGAHVDREVGDEELRVRESRRVDWSATGSQSRRRRVRVVIHAYGLVAATRAKFDQSAPSRSRCSTMRPTDPTPPGVLKERIDLDGQDLIPSTPRPRCERRALEVVTRTRRSEDPAQRGRRPAFERSRRCRSPLRQPSNNERNPPRRTRRAASWTSRWGVSPPVASCRVVVVAMPVTSATRRAGSSAGRPIHPTRPPRPKSAARDSSVLHGALGRGGHQVKWRRSPEHSGRTVRRTLLSNGSTA